jgi:hypothetical protein
LRHRNSVIAFGHTGVHDFSHLSFVKHSVSPRRADKIAGKAYTRGRRGVGQDRAMVCNLHVHSHIFSIR